MFTPVLELTVIITYPTSQQTFSVSERSEQQVRFLCAGGSGVWTSCRLDPILRLFDWSTGRPLQEVDFTVLVTKTLGAKTVFIFFHYTSILNIKIMRHECIILLLLFITILCTPVFVIRWTL